MRCKPGELAIITRPDEFAEPLRGRVVRVLVHVRQHDIDTWTLEAPESFVLRGNWHDPRNDSVFPDGARVVIRRALDRWLTPLRGFGQSDLQRAGESVADVLNAARREPAGG